MAEAQRNLEKARDDNVKRLEEMRKAHRIADEAEKERKRDLEKQIEIKKRLENERRAAIAKAHEEEAALQAQIKALTEEQLAATQNTKKKRMAQFMERVIDTVKTVTDALTGQNNAHEGLQTDHSDLNDGHTNLVVRVDENVDEIAGLKDTHKVLEDQVTEHKRQTHEAIAAAEVKTETSIHDATVELGDKMETQKHEINEYVRANVDHLGKVHNTLEDQVRIMGKDVQKGYELSHKGAYIDDPQRVIANFPKNKYSQITGRDGRFGKHDTTIQFSEYEEQKVDGGDPKPIRFRFDDVANAEDDGNVSVASTNASEAPISEEDGGDGEGSNEDTRRRLATVEFTPSERALQRRRLASRPKTHLCVLEALLEDIQTLH